MKGLVFSEIIWPIIIGLIFVFLIVSILLMFNVFSTSEGGSSLPKYVKKTNYDYSNFILDINSPPKEYVKLQEFTDKTKNQWLCKSLKSCIKRSLLTGKPCEFASIAYGNDLEGQLFFPYVGYCDDEDLTVKIAPNVEQKVCKFKQVDTINHKGGTGLRISDAVGLSFKNCIIQDGNVLFDQSAASTSGEAKEEFASSDTAINQYYSPDYSYEYMDYSTLTTNSYVGTGRAILAVGKVMVDEDQNCRFTTYFCPQSAIATSENDQSLNVFDTLRSIEIGHHIEIPYYIKNVSNSLPILTAGGSVDVSINEGWFCTARFDQPNKWWCAKGLTYYSDCDMTSGSNYNCRITGTGLDTYIFNTYYLPLDKDYHVVTIINAVKAGLYENYHRISSIAGENKFNNWAAPHWDIQVDKSIEGYKCWNNNYENRLKSNNVRDKTRSIYYNCGDDNKCDIGVAVNVGWRRDYSTDNVYDSGIVTFCELNCVDTEREEDLTARGSVVSRDVNGKPVVLSDECSDDTTLKEFTCSYNDSNPKGAYLRKDVDCKALGYSGCRNGACYK